MGRALSQDIGVHWDAKKKKKKKENVCFILKIWYKLVYGPKSGRLMGFSFHYGMFFKIDQYAFAMVFGSLSLSES